MTGTSERAALTVQEWRVALAVGAGASNKAVGQELRLSVKTVEFHLRNVYRKLGIGSRVELANHLSRIQGDILDDVRSGGNLPVQPWGLLGRDRQLAQLEHLLETRSLVTLTGVGGVGKTTLAIAVARRLGGRFPDGAWMVDLSTLNAGRDVVNACMVTLALRAPPSTPTADDLARALGQQQRLVIIDNCEHVVDEVARIVAAITSGCPNVAIVATSRERLDVVGEHVFPVPAMSVDDEDGISPAAQLFIERAAAAAGSFEPSAVEAELIGALCRRLDGLPLAIELAAARVAGFSLDDIARRLDDRFSLLTRRHAAADRHHSLYTTIDWSYALLSPAEQQAFESLSVFVGDFDLASARAIVGELDGGQSVDDCVGSLAGKSMVETAHTVDNVRYRLLETVRAFARERLDARGDELAVRLRHLHHFRSFIHDANVAVRGAGELGAHRAIAQEWHNLRTAMHAACDLDDGVAAAAIVEDVLWWAMTRVRVEAGEWSDRVRRLPSVTAPPSRTIATLCSAYFAWVRGNFADAEHLFTTACDDERTFGELAEPWPPVIALVIGFFTAGLHELSQETLRRGRRSGDPFWETQGLLQQAESLGIQLADGDAGPDRVDEHLASIRAALDAATALGHPQSIARGTRALGEALGRAEPERARQLLEDSIAIAEPLGLELLAGQARQALVKLHTRCARPDDALRVAATSIRAHLRTGDLGEVAWDLASATRALLQLRAIELTVAVIRAIEAADPNAHQLYKLERVRSTLAGRIGAERARRLDERPVATILDIARNVVELADRLH